jgi:hypothetical protein
MKTLKLLLWIIFSTSFKHGKKITVPFKSELNEAELACEGEE